jgi:probable F420-dependent oxidoreductase
MKFGILPPYRTGVTADPDWMVAFAQLAESLEFESLYVVEHAVVPAGYAATYPYSETGRMPLPEDCPIPDLLELLAFLAAVTERIVLATGILVLPEHNPVILAKRLATIDVLSGGRMRLGIGVGWMREELEAVGVDFDTRGARTDELIEAMRALWEGDEGTFAGEFFSFERAVSRPQPLQPGGIPIHVGGHSKAAARRAGRYAEGFQPLGLDGEALTQRLALMRGTAIHAGRDPDAIELSLGGLLDLLDADAVKRAEDQGADRLVVSTRFEDLDVLGAAMTAFAEQHIR